MKSLVKYIIASVFLLILIGNKSHSDYKLPLHTNFSSQSIVKNQIQENSSYLFSEDLNFATDELLELNEENCSRSDISTNFSIENTVSNSLTFGATNPYFWKNFKFRENNSSSFQVKIYILVRNFRI